MRKLSTKQLTVRRVFKKLRDAGFRQSNDRTWWRRVNFSYISDNNIYGPMIHICVPRSREEYIMYIRFNGKRYPRLAKTFKLEKCNPQAIINSKLFQTMLAIHILETKNAK